MSHNNIIDLLVNLAAIRLSNPFFYSVLHLDVMLVWMKGYINKLSQCYSTVYIYILLTPIMS